MRGVLWMVFLVWDYDWVYWDSGQVYNGRITRIWVCIRCEAWFAHGLTTDLSNIASKTNFQEISTHESL